MIILKSTDSLRIKLDSTPSGSPPDECHCMTSYRVTSDVTYVFDRSLTYSNGTNDVDLAVGTSASGAETVIDEISIYNPSSVPKVKLTVFIYDGSDEYVLVKQELDQNQTLTYNDKQGWQIK